MGMMALASFGIAAIQGLQQHQQAAAQAELNNAIKRENNKQAYESMLSTFKSLEVQADQVGENFISNSIDQQKAEARARGTAVSASGASGTGGTSLDMQLQEASVESDMNLSRMQINKDRQLDSIASHGRDAVNVANQRLDRMPDQQAPSLLETTLNIGMNGFRNTVAMNDMASAYDSNFGSGGAGFSTESLYDAPVNDNGLRYT